MISELIFNSDVFSGQILYIDHIKTTGAKSVFAAPINQFGTGSGSNIISLRSGQLGIGIIDPAFPLHVNGDGQLGGSFTVSGSSVIEGDNYTVSDSYIGGDFSVTGSSLTKGSSIIEGSSVIEGSNYTVTNSYVGGNFYVTGSSVIDGDLTVNGESFIVEATTVKIEDKNLEIGISSTGAETDSTADGGGITLHGDAPKTILWSNATDSWDLSENVGVADGKFIFSDKLRARDSAGLSLEDDGGNGIFIEDGGDVGIGTTNPAVGLEINHTDALKIPKGTTVQRPTSNSATHKGYIRYNTTTDQFEGFGAGNAWGSLGGVVDVDQDTYISAENSAGSDNDELKFFTSGSPRAIIDSAGNVGIGTTSPVHKLQIDAGTLYAATRSVVDNLSWDMGVAGSTASNADLRGKFYMWDATNSQTRFVIDANGNVGIGTTNPGERLDVNGRIYIGNSSAPVTTTNRLYSVGGILYWDGENVLHARDTIGEMEDTSIGTKSNGQVLIWNATSSKWVNNALTGGNGIDVTNAAGGITISHTDTSSAASSNNSGRTYIQDIGLDTYGHVTSLSTATETVVDTNTTYTAGTGLDLTGTTFSVESDLRGEVTLIGSSTNDYVQITSSLINFAKGGVVKMQLQNGGDLHVDGDVLAFSSTVSDERLKDNATEIKGALNKIKAMRGVSYTWNKGSRKGQKDIGVIAQEVEQVIPEIVRDYKFEVGEFEGDETKYKTVDYEKLAAVLIEAVKELSDKLDQKTCCCCKANHNPKN